MSAEDRLKELGLTLPEVPTPVANYVSFKQVGDMLYLSAGPQARRRHLSDGQGRQGRVGRGGL